MRTKILSLSVALIVLAGCEPTSEPISEEMFVSGPAAETTTSAPLPATTLPESTTVTELGPDGQPIDPALALVEEDPYGVVEEGGADGLTERLPDTCKLENFQQYVGLTKAEVDAAGLSVPYRVVGPTDIVTQEYNPMRVNFSTDRNGRIGRVSCG